MEFKEALKNVLDELEPSLDKEIAKELRRYFMENSEQIEKLLVESFPSDEELRQRIEESLDRKKLSKEEYHLEKEHLEKLLIQGMTQAEALNVDHKVLDGLYSLGYSHYNHGKYREAQTFFCYLTLLNDKDPKYFFAAGAAFHMQKDYMTAIGYYTICSYLDWMNPLPWFHLADCYYEIKDFPMALTSLENVFIRTKNSKMYAKLYDRAKFFKERIIQKIDESLKVGEGS